jgi:citrate/tricarballylate utilization protein
LSGRPPEPALLLEARRQLDVCNACRYCEGYCAVFPAVARRSGPLLWERGLQAGDLAHLANLCHDCRACWQACMYAPPHDLAINLPILFSQARVDSYAASAWPAGVGRWAFAHARAAVLLATLVGLVLAVAAALATAGVAGLLGVHTGPGAFYAVVPYLVMAVPALVVSGYVLVVLAAGFARFWKHSGGRVGELLDGRLWLTAAGEALGLRWLGGGGGGCHYPDPDRPSGVRRWLHGFLLAGLAVTFAATVVAALFQDVLGWPPPYPVLSLPVALGTLGGVGVIASSTGLLLLKPGHDELAPATSRALDVAFLAILDLAAITGMLTLALRSTPALGLALTLHLGTLAGLYATAPYGKLAHGTLRLAALLRDVQERRQRPASAGTLT